MDAANIRQYLQLLGQELQSRGVTAEIVLVGGAVMLLVIGNRPTTRDIDAYFASHPQEVRDAAQVIAKREGLTPDWLNDAVKGFFFSQPPMTLWLDYPGLRVYTADPPYVLAMKAIAARPTDIPDIEALITYLGLKSPQEALAIVNQYVPASQVLPKTQYLLESLFP